MLNFIIQYWIHFLFGILISLFLYLIKIVKAHKKTIECNIKGMALLLKIQIMDNYKKIIEKKSITVNEKNNFDLLYENYICFEQNQVITDLYERINSIPID